jgi:hypothetical protein
LRKYCGTLRNRSRIVDDCTCFNRHPPLGTGTGAVGRIVLVFGTEECVRLRLGPGGSEHFSSKIRNPSVRSQVTKFRFFSKTVVTILIKFEPYMGTN